MSIAVRQQAILRLVRNRALSTQAELVDALREEGHDVVQTTISRDVQELGNVKPPKAMRDASYGGRKLGHGKGYVYPHDDPRGFEAENLPEELRGRTYYRPSGNGEEKEEDG